MKDLKRIFIFLSLSIITLAISLQAAKLPDGLYAEFSTIKGKILLRLEFEKAPMTTANFVGLAEGTIRNTALGENVPYFNGSIWHRVVPGHVVQAGRPGHSDREGPGYSIPNEIVPGLSHDHAGVLGMANSGPHTNGSQFYITLGDRSYLDGDYTVFGEVVSGMDTVNATVQGDVIRSVKIIRRGKAAKAFASDEESFRKMVQTTTEKVRKLETEKRKIEKDRIRNEWPDLEAPLQYRILKEGDGERPYGPVKLKVRYTGKTLGGMTFCSDETGRPAPIDAPQSFEFIPGRSQINPGLDLILSRMKKGEKRLLVLLPEMAYGTSGFYAKSVPGKKRFVIHPGTVLVYEIELIDIY